MKINKRELRQIIREEVANLMETSGDARIKELIEELRVQVKETYGWKTFYVKVEEDSSLMTKRPGDFQE